MEDHQIIDLYWARSEEAIPATQHKYGSYCHAVARNILPSQEDCEECVNDTYLRAWNVMPPQRPANLRTFLGKITRNLSLDRWRRNHAQSRGFRVSLALEELSECIPALDPTEQILEDMAITAALNRFLSRLSPLNRRIFLRRYWYLCSVKEIAVDFNIGESRVKMILLRARKQLKDQLEKEGIQL